MTESSRNVVRRLPSACHDLWAGSCLAAFHFEFRRATSTQKRSTWVLVAGPPAALGGRASFRSPLELTRPGDSVRDRRPYVTRRERSAMAAGLERHCGTLRRISLDSPPRVEGLALTLKCAARFPRVTRRSRAGVDGNELERGASVEGGGGFVLVDGRVLGDTRVGAARPLRRRGMCRRSTAIAAGAEPSQRTSAWHDLWIFRERHSTSRRSHGPLGWPTAMPELMAAHNPLRPACSRRSSTTRAPIAATNEFSALCRRSIRPRPVEAALARRRDLKGGGPRRRGHEIHVSRSLAQRSIVGVSGRRGHDLPHCESRESRVPVMRSRRYWLAYLGAELPIIFTPHGRSASTLVTVPEYGGKASSISRDLPSPTARYVVQLHGQLAMFDRIAGLAGSRDSPSLDRRCFMERNGIDHADSVLASSLNTAEFRSAYIRPSRSTPIRVIHSGLEVVVSCLVHAQADESQPRILFVGNIVDAKACSLSLSGRTAKHACPHRLRVIGEGLEEAGSALSRSSNAEGSLELVGAPRTRICRSTTRGQTCSSPRRPSSRDRATSTLEAMACGTPWSPQHQRGPRGRARRKTRASASSRRR